MHPNFLMLEGLWDGLYIKYIYSEQVTPISLIMYVVNLEILENNWLDDIPKRKLQDNLFIGIQPDLYVQLFGQVTMRKNSRFFSQAEVTNPSILHLSNQLKSEMQTPKCLNKEFVFAIITVMIRYTENHKVTKN